MQFRQVIGMLNQLLDKIKPGTRLPDGVDQRTLGPVLDSLIQGLGTGPRKSLAMRLNFGRASSAKPSRKVRERQSFINTLTSTGMPLDKANAQADRLL